MYKPTTLSVKEFAIKKARNKKSSLGVPKKFLTTGLSKRNRRRLTNRIRLGGNAIVALREGEREQVLPDGAGLAVCDVVDSLGGVSGGGGGAVQ